MISITMPDLEISHDDAQVITEMYKSHLRETRGYNGPVLVLANGLYEIHKDSSKQIARMWIRICQHDSKASPNA